MQPSAPAASGPIGLAVLGATGSIGTQTLDIVRLFPDRFKVVALSAGRNVALLLDQIREFQPACVVVGDPEAASQLERQINGSGVRVLRGQQGLCDAAVWPGVDTVVAALVGFAGLRSVMVAIRAGKRIALANKETLVVAGELVNGLLETHDAEMLPVDSEHSAIFQSLVGEPPDAIETLILTASGGPFRNRPADSFEAITVREALAHPNWSMGSKITIDSATLMNKGLEVIEARWLFRMPQDQIQVVIHPQSIIHSMVVFNDGSTKAQLGVPDMKVPIQYALTYPDRWPAPHPRVDWHQVGQLDFHEPDLNRFPCLALAFEALRQGGTAPAILNAANEEAVALFLQEKIRFVDIPRVIEHALQAHPITSASSYEALTVIDADVRRFVAELKLQRQIQ